MDITRVRRSVCIYTMVYLVRLVSLIHVQTTAMHLMGACEMSPVNMRIILNNDFVAMVMCP